MTNPLEQAQQQLRELRDSLQKQLDSARTNISYHEHQLAKERATRDGLTAALKRVEATLAPRTRKPKEAVAPAREAAAPAQEPTPQ